MNIYLTLITLLISISTCAQVKLDSLFAVPKSYQRLVYSELSFANYVQNKTLVNFGIRQYLTTNTPFENQRNHAALIDMTSFVKLPNTFDCADFVVTYLSYYDWNLYNYLKPFTVESYDIHTNKTYDEYAYDYTLVNLSSGETVIGEMFEATSVSGYKYQLIDTLSVGFTQSSGKYETFMNWAAKQPTIELSNNIRYLQHLYGQTNTTTLMQDVVSIPLADIQPGDVFITPKTPTVIGHVCMVMDVAVNDQTGDKVFLIGQGMPSQTPHVLNNPLGKISPVWYSLSEITGGLRTPSFIYPNPAQALKRFKAVVPFVKEL